MSKGDYENTPLLISIGLISFLLGGLFSFYVGALLFTNIYLAVALGIGGVIVSRWISETWIKSMIRAGKNPIRAAFYFFLMALVLCVSLFLMLYSGIV